MLNQAWGPAKAAQVGTAPESLGSFWSWMSQDGSVMGLQPLVRSTLNSMRKQGGPLTMHFKIPHTVSGLHILATNQ